jgi:hypothetical protein
MAQVNTELGYASNAYITLNDSAVRTLAGKATGAISMSDLHGKSAGSGSVIASDNFNRADGALGSNWSSVPMGDVNSSHYGMPTILSNIAQGSGAVARWSAHQPNSNHYAEARLLGDTCGVRVRQASDRDNCYVADRYYEYDYDTDMMVTGSELVIRVNGVWTALASWADYPNFIRLEASGSTLTVKMKNNAGDAWTTKGSVTNTSVIGGWAGIECGNGSVDDFAFGNL